MQTTNCAPYLFAPSFIPSVKSKQSTGVTITGGQEWPESMQTAKRTATRFSTLNPIWKEHFVLRVPRAEAVLRIEVKDYDFPALNDYALGQTAIPLDDLAHHRFLYRPHVELSFVFQVERRSARFHVEKLMGQGRVVEAEPGRFRAAA